MELDRSFRPETENDHKQPIKCTYQIIYCPCVFSDRLKAFQPNFSQPLVSENINLPLVHSTSVFVLHQNRISKCPFSFLLKEKIYSIRVFLLLKQSFLCITCMTISSGQTTQKVDLNVSTQNSTFSHISKIKRCTIQDYYVIKIGNRLSSSTVYASQSTQV